MDILNSLFDQEDPKDFYGEITEVKGSRYTLKDQYGRIQYSYSSDSYRVGQWVLSEKGKIVQSVRQPSTVKVYEV